MRVTLAIATAGFFRTLGVSAELGRAFTREEDMPNAAPVVVLSHELWQSAFAGDRAIVGQNAMVNGVQRQVVGVMPRGFDIEDAGVQLWVPTGLDPAQRTNNRGSHFLNVVGRLRAGSSLEQARTEMEALLQRWHNELGGTTHAPDPERHRIVINSLRGELIGPVRRALFLLLGAVGFVLLIACANMANLQLARAESRQTEIAVRAAMGAGRQRLVRQFLTEAMCYALVGGAVGLGMAVLGTKLLLAGSAHSVPRTADISLDGRVVLFTLAVSLLTGILFGLAPLLNLTNRSTNSALREGGARATASRGRQRLRRLLVVSETALAVVLAVGSALMLRSFAALQSVDPGFDPHNLLTFGLYLPGTAYPHNEEQAGFYTRLESQLKALPAVTGVAAMSGLPPRRNVNANDMEFEGYVFVPNSGKPVPNADYWQYITADYLETMQIPLVSGRGFRPGDDATAPPVALINERLAKLFYAGQDPIGRRLRPGFGPNNTPPPWFTIVGVVKDVKQGGLEQQAGSEVYFHYPQVGPIIGIPRTMNVVVRTTRPPLGLLDAVRAEVRAIDPQLPMSSPGDMESVLGASIARPRFLTLLLGIFAAVALSLAAVGTYGVMSYSVTQRRLELGVRMALGAGARGVLGLVLGQGLAVAGVGLLLGVGGSFALSRLLRSLLFEVKTTDAIAFITAPALLGIVALAACAIPALRAARLDPAKVLRRE